MSLVLFYLYQIEPLLQNWTFTPAPPAECKGIVVVEVTVPAKFWILLVPAVSMVTVPEEEALRLKLIIRPEQVPGDGNTTVILVAPLLNITLQVVSVSVIPALTATIPIANEPATCKWEVG